MILLVLIETLMAMGGYFSSFKTFIMLLIAALLLLDALSAHQLTYRKLILSFFLLTVGSVMFIMLSAWQVIKPLFRAAINGGSGMQENLLSKTETFDLIAGLISRLSLSDLMLGLSTGLNRLSYNQYFAGTLKTVPEKVDYQFGYLTFEAIQFLIPRVFWSGKPLADDSLRTNTYSGFRVAGADEGASIGLGYIAEAYVDFGVFFFVALFVIGMFIGQLINLVSKVQLDLKVALIICFGMQYLLLLEMSLLKIISGSIFFCLLLLITAPIVDRLTLK
jgi:hypothetical protein